MLLPPWLFELHHYKLCTCLDMKRYFMHTQLQFTTSRPKIYSDDYFKSGSLSAAWVHLQDSWMKCDALAFLLDQDCFDFRHLFYKWHVMHVGTFKLVVICKANVKQIWADQNMFRKWTNISVFTQSCSHWMFISKFMQIFSIKFGLPAKNSHIQTSMYTKTNQ